MNKELKSDLVIEAASKVHEDWCLQELKAFYERAKLLYEIEKNYLISLKKACFKGEVKRNEIFVDIKKVLYSGFEEYEIFKDFSIFIKLVQEGAVEVKKFTKREVSSDEQEKLGQNYRNGEENILVDFKSLSTESKKENLEAAIGAVNVFEEFQKAGISIEEMENNLEILNQIGVAIHLDWLKRNPNHQNDYLKVPYNQLDEWTQQQDITVFKALLETVKKNPQKYHVDKVEGYELPNYQSEEKAYFGIKGLN